MNVVDSFKSAQAAATAPLRKTGETLESGAASLVHVDSPSVQYYENFITANYNYQETIVHASEGPGKPLRAVPTETNYTFRTSTAVPRTGVMIVGWGGNNGTTLTAALLANRKELTWETKEGTNLPHS